MARFNWYGVPGNIEVVDNYQVVESFIVKDMETANRVVRNLNRGIVADTIDNLLDLAAYEPNGHRFERLAIEFVDAIKEDSHR